MRRRDLILIFGGAGLGPRFAFEQIDDRIPVVGTLAPIPVTDGVYRRNFGAVVAGLRELGWIEGKNVRFEPRGANQGDADQLQKLAAELVALKPAVIGAVTAIALTALRRETDIIPIVFNVLDDPVGQGFVASVVRPGGNVTGFVQYEPSIGGKWLEALKEIAPNTSRVEIISNPATASVPALYRNSFETAAASFGMQVTAAADHDPGEIERVMAEFARKPDGGLLLPPDPFTVVHRAQVIAAAARLRLPTIYPYSFMAADGGLMSYGYDQIYQGHEVAGYIDRILRGAKPSDLPIQSPKKYELVLNLKTAKALGLIVPPSLLATADDVIE